MSEQRSRKIPIIGEPVRIHSKGHLMDGRTGLVTFHSEYMGTVGVFINGEDHIFMTGEVFPEASK